MKQSYLIYMAILAVFMSCSESEYDGTRVPSLSRRYMKVTNTRLSFSSGEATQSVKVESDETPWTVTIPVDWMTATPMSGNNSATVMFTSKPNSSADVSRVCVAQIASTTDDWSRSFSVTMTQEKAQPSITVSSNQLTCNATSQALKVKVQSNTGYTVSNSAESWLHVSTTADGLTMQVDENTTDADRTAVVTIQGKTYTAITAVVNVRQKRGSISSTLEELTFSHVASSKSIVINSHVAWTASVRDGWFSVSPTKGNAGETEVTVSVAHNASVNSRSGSAYFVINGTNSIEVPITQEGIRFDVSTTDVAFSSATSTETLNITSNDTWEVKSKPDWISLNTMSGSGDATLRLTATENNTTTARQGELIIETTDGVISKTVALSQAAKTVEYGDVNISFGYASSSQTTSFITDGSWSLTTDDSWITVDKTSGAGNATLLITTEENMTTSPREGKITVLIAGNTYTITVYQTCKYLTLASSAFSFDATAGSTSVSVSSNTTWNASITEGADWITISPIAGNANATLDISVAENNTVSARIGKIQLEIPGVQTYIIDIQQNRKYVKTDMSSVDFVHSGGQITVNITSDGTYEVSKVGGWFGFIRTGDVITVIAQENTTGAERSGALILTMQGLTGGTYSVMVPVTQK